MLLGAPHPTLTLNRGIVEQHGSNVAMQDLDVWLGPVHALASTKTNGDNQDEVNLPAAALLVNVGNLLQ